MQGLYGAIVVREPTQDPATEHVILMEDYDGTAGITRTQMSLKTFSGEGLSSWEGFYATATLGRLAGLPLWPLLSKHGGS